MKWLLVIGVLALVGCGASAVPETPIASVAVPVPIQEQETPGQVEDAGVEALEVRVAELEENLKKLEFDLSMVSVYQEVLLKEVGKKELEKVASDRNMEAFLGTAEECVEAMRSHYSDEQWTDLHFNVPAIFNFRRIHAGEEACRVEAYYQSIPLKERVILGRIEQLVNDYSLASGEKLPRR